METKKQNVILTYGLIGGLISILSFILLYFGGAELFVNPLAFGFIIIPIVILVLACRAQKKQNEGFLTFSEALKTAFGVAVIMALCSSIATYVVLNFIDTGFKERLQQLTIERTQELMKKFGAPQDQIDKSVQKLATEDQYSVSKTLINFAVGCIMWFIISLIIAAIVKKKKPEFPGAAS